MWSGHLCKILNRMLDEAPITHEILCRYLYEVLCRSYVGIFSRAILTIILSNIFLREDRRTIVENCLWNFNLFEAIYVE